MASELTPQDRPIVLYDGVCGLCNRAVQFILKRDQKRRFRFATLQGTIGQEVLERDMVPANLDSMMLVETDGRVSWESTAALRTARYLKFPWPLFSILLLIPRFVRDLVYRWIARNRYRWFGKLESCPLPDPKEADRFL